MNITRKISAMAVILIAACALLAPLTGLAADTIPDVDAVAAQAAEQAGKEIEKAFAENDPGEEIGKAIGDAMGSMGSPSPGVALLIPIMGIFGALIAPMLTICLIIWLAFRYREHKQQRNHETIRLMIEKGVPIPPDLSFGDTVEKGSPLNRGLKYMGIGAGLIVFFLVMGMENLAGIGAIPLFVGLAYLLIWRLEKNKTETGQAG